MDLHLAGRTALITGASKGIGLAVAQSFAAEGVNLVLTARSKDLLEEAAADSRAKHKIKVDIVAADLSDQTVRDRLVADYPDIDILINNAGAIPGGTIFEVDDKAWRAGWDLKVFGYVNLTRAYFKEMAQRKRGVIICICGLGGEKLDFGYIAGAAGNASLMAFARAMGGRSVDQGVRVLAVNPGPVLTIAPFISARSAPSANSATKIVTKKALRICLMAGRRMSRKLRRWWCSSLPIIPATSAARSSRSTPVSLGAIEDWPCPRRQRRTARSSITKARVAGQRSSSSTSSPALAIPSICRSRR